jgi:hypothetical protein
MAASFSFWNAASAELGRRERSRAEAGEAAPMANPAAVATVAARSEVTNFFPLFKIGAGESGHLNLIISPSKRARRLTIAQENIPSPSRTRAEARISFTGLSDVLKLRVILDMNA